MVRLAAMVFVLLFAGFGAAKPSSYKVSTLENGLDVITMESHKVPLVTIVLASKAGAMTEAKSTDGLTHLWEHMFFKGNKRLPNQEAFKKRVRELGIVYNGDTSAEKVRYYFTLPAIFLEEGLQFMADAIMTPLLEDKELERERRVVLDEYDRNASSPEFDLYRLQRKIIYGDLDYLRNPLGHRPTIEKATREQLLKIKDEVFVPKNSAILVSGDFDAKKIDGLIKKYFSSWANPKGWQRVKQPDFPKFPAKQEIVMTNKEVHDVTIGLSFEGPRVSKEPKDSFAADILISLLSHKSGKFYKKYIDSGLAFHSGLSYYTQSQAGEVTLFATTKADNALKVKKLLENEPQEWLKKGYFTDTQLEDVRRSLLVGHKFELNQPSGYIKTLAFWWAVTGVDYYSGYLENLRKTSLDDVRAFVQKYLIKKPYIETVFLSPDDAKKIGLKDNSAPLMAKFFKE